MSNDVMFWLLLGFFCFFALSLIFIYKGVKRRSVTEWMFWRWVVLYGVVATYLGFIYVGVGRRAVNGELLLKGGRCFLAFLQLSLVWCIWASRVCLWRGKCS
ncbi:MULTISPECIES: hypothetical protein [unclassified Bartonella]|uniref:hypothetical protein n=1 Tax=unclassified Bartonella TaxID=2645622 RepID=UPI0035CE9F85